MNELPAQFLEDRALRDAARDVLLADLAHVRASLSTKSVASRVGSRIGEGAMDVFEMAKTQAEDNRGILAILFGAIILWFAREPIFSLFRLGQGSEELDGQAQTDDSEGGGSHGKPSSSPDVHSGENDE